MDDPSLSLALAKLSSSDVLSRDEAADIIRCLKETLISEDSEMDWDDAYDAIHLLSRRHREALVYLEDMVKETNPKTRRERYAVEWAQKAMKKIQGELR